MELLEQCTAAAKADGVTFEAIHGPVYRMIEQKWYKCTPHGQRPPHLQSILRRPHGHVCSTAPHCLRDAAAARACSLVSATAASSAAGTPPAPGPPKATLRLVRLVLVASADASGCTSSAVNCQRSKSLIRSLDDGGRVA